VVSTRRVAPDPFGRPDTWADARRELPL
jgi:hypothetical protein